MTDLVAGRYPVAEEEWVLDGTPYPPYRRTISRRDIASGSAGLAVGTSQVLSVFPVAVQDGDIFNYVSFLIAVAGATLAHSWVAVYTGTATGAALLAQVADNTTSTGWAVGGQKLQLASQILADLAQPGTPQGVSGGPGYWATTPLAGPTVVGVAVYQSGTTLNKFDAMPGSGAANGAVAVTGQAPMATFSAGLGAISAAPSVLPTMTPANGPVPYLLLSRQ